LLKIGKPAEALKEFRTCRRQYPDEPVYHNAVAAVLAAQGDLAGAQVEFTEAERMNPHYAQPHIELARIYLSLGEDDRARKELHAAVQAAPNQVETLTNVARILAVNSTAAKSDGADALALALRANALSGNREPEVFDVLGMAFAATGDFTNAVVCAQNALELAPAANLKNTNEFHLRLERYQNRQPWRELLGGTNAANSPAGQ